MKRSAASSSSPVVTPARAFCRSIARQRARTRPAAAIFSISSGDFRTITRRSLELLQLLFETKRGERGTDVVVHLAGLALAVEAAEQVLVVVVVDERWVLVGVDVEPVFNGLGLV